MAIIQISKIQQRSGNLVDLPQLDDAQLGWANDARRLFIGRGAPYDPENIEVLTSYSNISFSQINGSDGGNFNLSNAQNGQILTYVDTTNTWENWPSTDILTANANFKVNLGNVENIKITGNAATGFVLETDGLGNLSWTPKGVVVSEIANVTQANPGVITTVNNHYLVNSAQVTITDVVGMTELNGISYFVDVLTSNTFALYSDISLTTAVDTTGYTAYVSGGQVVGEVGSGVSTPGGSANTIQFNNGGFLDGSPFLTINDPVAGVLEHSGPYFTVGNVYANAGNIGANILTANVLTVSGNANIGNIGTAGLITATGNVTAGNLVTGGIISSTGNANVGNLGTSGLITATGNITGGNLVTGGVISATGNANVGNLGTSGLITATGNITGGNLVTGGVISATGNANVGNINVNGHIIPTANVTYDLGNSTNLFRDLYLSGTSIKLGTQTITSNSLGVALSNAVYTTTLSVTGNSNIGNIGSGGLITATGNITGGNLITGGLITATGTLTSSDITTSRTASPTQGYVYYGNTGTRYTGYDGANFIIVNMPVSAAGNITGGNLITSGLVTATGNIEGGNLVTGGALSVTGNANVGNIGATNIVGTLTTASQTNITAIGTVASLSVTGNANIGNIGTAGLITATGNIQGGNLVTGGVVSASGNATVLGIKTDNYYYANGAAISFAGTYSNSNVANYLPTYNGNVGGGTATFYGTTLTTGANTTAGTITGNWSLSSGSKLIATYADLAEYYEADQDYEYGTVLEFGGEKEVTLAQDGTTRIAGVVSKDPAYVMNGCCPGYAVPIALQGRVPCKVKGKIRKGDLMVSAGNGYARPWNNATTGMVIGKAIENFEGISGIIEVAVGRL